jgi:AcrR family transcriptional regulator
MVRKLNPEKKAQFMRTALRLFVGQGVQNTSTAEIARDAGTAAGTLFIYFPTKQDLIHALILQIGRQQSEYIKSLLVQPMPARETFQAIWHGSITWFLENMQAYQYVQQVRDSGIIAAEVVMESEKYFEYYYQAIQKGLEEQSIRPYPLELIGGMLYQDIVAIMNLIGRQPDRLRQEQYIHAGFDVFWNGIKAAVD